jgi:formate/nitrite transporter FocA (FNT family)
MIIWMLTFVVGLGNFAHCIAASGEILTAVLIGKAAWASYGNWLFFAVAGNICGGVGLVTLLEYGQVIYGKDSEAEAIAPATKEEPRKEESKPEELVKP